MTCRLLLGLCSACLLAILAAACSGSGDALRAGQNSSAPGSKPATPELPSPAALMQQLRPSSRSASYVPADLSLSGDSFDSSMPHASVVSQPGLASFSPATGAGANGLSGMAFAVYHFVIPDYDGDSSLHYALGPQSGEPADLYIGLANWGDERWDWFTGNTEGLIQPGSMQDYFVLGGNLLAVVAVQGDQPFDLTELRIGSRPPLPSLAASPLLGKPPLLVQFDASASTDPDGSIAEFRWDPEGDGSFDVSTGADPLFSFNYEQQAAPLAAVRVIDDKGVHADAALGINVVSESAFTYGASGVNETVADLLVTTNGDLIVLGAYTSSGMGARAFISRLRPDGTEVFARSWGSDGSHSFADAEIGSDQLIYVCGTTKGGTQFDSGGLLQQWDQDGNLLRSRQYGAGTGLSFNGIDRTFDSIYACGTFRPSITADGLIARLDLDGNPVWATRIKSPQDCELSEVQSVTPNFFGAVESVRCCGIYDENGINGDSFFASFTNSGGLNLARVLDSIADFDHAVGFVCTDAVLPQNYVFGEIFTASGQVPYLSNVSGSAVTIDAANTDSLNSIDIIKSSGNASLLLRRQFGSASSLVLGSFNFSLAPLADLEIGALPDGVVNGGCLANYGQDIALGTAVRKELPGESSIDLTVSAAAFTWVDVTPAFSDASLNVTDAALETTALADFSAGNPPEQSVSEGYFHIGPLQ